MLRQDQGLRDGAAFRLDRAIRMARSILVVLALERRRVRRKVRKLRRKHPDTGWVLLSALAAVLLGVLIAHFGA
jgi:hypothetical protein